MEKPKITDLEVILVLFYKDEMIKLGIIDENVKWDCLSDEQKVKVKDFLNKKIEEKKGQKICY